MIYLIRSAAVEDGKFFYILKIGYTDDTKEGIRFGAYKNHNPTYEVLYKIPEATKEQENQLHALFKKFRRYNVEWYNYEEDIINYFKANPTKEDLDGSIFKSLMSSDRKDLPRKYRQNIITEKAQLKAKIDDYVKKNSSNQEIIDLLNKLSNLTRFSARMKLICLKTGDFGKNTRDGILLIFGKDYLNYYNTIGPKKIKALLYRPNLLKSEYNRLVNNQVIDLENVIYDNFIVGEKYLNTTIKSMLAKIFKDNKFKETPKANLLDRYFNIKECLISDKEAGKRNHGVIILSKKGED